MKHEMQWTMGYFKNKKEEWESMAADMEDLKDGLKCYANKQADVWERFERHAELVFSRAAQF